MHLAWGLGVEGAAGSKRERVLLSGRVIFPWGRSAVGRCTRRCEKWLQQGYVLENDLGCSTVKGGFRKASVRR